MRGVLPSFGVVFRRLNSLRVLEKYGEMAGALAAYDHS
jgi:hypothetical protein